MAVYIDQYFIPYEKQFDSGFRALADSYMSAANSLEDENKMAGFGLMDSPMPMLFLYRHALELFLKSALITVHRRFTSTYPKFDKEDFPSISGKSIKNIHSIEQLWNGLQSLMDTHKHQLQKIADTDWYDTPRDFVNALNKVHNFDVRSDVFRYPVTAYSAQDNQKSSYKKMEAAAIQARLDQKSNPAMIFAYKNEKDELTEIYQHDYDDLKPVYTSLKLAVETANGLAIGLHAELTG